MDLFLNNLIRFFPLKGDHQMTYFSTRDLSQRLERTEACYNADFVSSRLKMFPDSGVEWIEVKGAYAMFDGVESPLTQTFGLGLFEALTSVEIAAIEAFYHRHGAPIFHEVSPLADPSHMSLLHRHGYHPIEQTTIMYLPLSKENMMHVSSQKGITSRILSEGEEDTWARLSAEGWGAEMAGLPGLMEFMYQFSRIAVRSTGAWPFIAEFNGTPISTGMLYIKDDTALLAGDSTILDGRNKGAQNALFDARLRCAVSKGCTMAMVVTSPGSQSQRNAEKNGFRIAYTRTKWGKNA